MKGRRLFRLPIRRPAALEEELDDEVRLHLELRAAQLEAQGMSPEAARAEARRRFGPQVEMRRDAARRERTLALRERLGDLGRDLGRALRGLRRSPTFTAAAIVTLALGIGATTAIWSVVYPVLFEPLPYPQAQRVVLVWEREPSGATSNVGFATFTDVAGHNRSFEAVAALRGWTPTITGGGPAERLEGQRVSPTYFSVLGVRPALGRDFRPEDDVRGEQPVVILSYPLWQSRFGGAPDVVGTSVTVGGTATTVIGVMPEGFENFLEPEARLWAPLRYDASLSWACRTCRHLRMAARLRPGVSPQQADAEMNVLSESLFRQHPTEYPGPGMSVVPLHEQVVGGVRPALLVLLAAVGMVLLVASANVTNLLLARAGQRRGELAIHAALGATRWRVVRSLLTEGLVVAVLGGALGVAVAVAGVRVLLAISPAGLPRLDQIRVDGAVLAFALAVTAAVGVVFGLVPGLEITRGGLWRGLRRGGRRTVGGSHRTRALLVVAQVAFTLVLLTGAGLLLRSLGRLVSTPPGFEPRGLLTLQLAAAGPRYDTAEATRAFFGEVLEKVRGLPAVESAAFTSQLPLSEDFDRYSVHLESRPRANPEEDPSAHRYAVSGGYLETMGLRLLRGRDLDAHDAAGQPEVALINRSFAARELAGLDPLGQRVRLGAAEEGPWWTIVGIVADAKQTSLAAGVADAVYVPEAQWPWADNQLSLVVRSGTDAGALTAAVRQAVADVDPDQPLTRVVTMEELLRTSTSRTRFALFLFGTFAAVALLLAAVGLFGVLAGTVTERRAEIGVRTALGATRPEILRLVARRGLALTLAGTLVGVVGSLGFGTAIDSLLFGVSHGDLPTYLGVSSLLLAVAALACWLPARRAARIDPVEALRTE